MSVCWSVGVPNMSHTWTTEWHSHTAAPTCSISSYHPLIWSHVLVHVKTLAAAFWTIWRHFMLSNSRRENKALQSPSLDEIKAWIKMSASAMVRKGFVLAMLHSWSNAILVISLMWWLKERVESNVTPSFLTAELLELVRVAQVYINVW